MIRIIVFIFALILGMVLGSLAHSGPIPNPYEEIQKLLGSGDVNGARTLLIPLAESGDLGANWGLVQIYIYSGPRFRNIEEGIKVLTRLSDLNDPNSKEALGDLYYYGTFVPQDYKKAAEWYADYVKYERDPDILTRYGLLFAMGKGVEQDKSEAFRLFSEAAVKGYLPAYLLARKVYQSIDSFDRLFLQ